MNELISKNCATFPIEKKVATIKIYIDNSTNYFFSIHKNSPKQFEILSA